MLGIWARIPLPQAHTPPELAQAWQALVLRVPLVVFAVSLSFLLLGLWRHGQPGPQDVGVWRWIMGCAVVAGLLVVAGWDKWRIWHESPAGPEWLSWTRTRWLMEPRAIDVFMAAWAVATALLLLGLCSRVSAVAVWALGMSFDNLNPNINNAGDQLRSILTFYLMCSPCGAGWSLDRWLAAAREQPTRTAIRLAVAAAVAVRAADIRLLPERPLQVRRQRMERRRQESVLCAE